MKASSLESIKPILKNRKLHHAGWMQKKQDSENYACALDHTTGGECDADVRIILRRDWKESDISRLCLLRSAILVVAEVRLKPEHLAGQGGGADRISAAEVGLGYRVHAESRNMPEHPMGLFQDGCMGNAYAA